MANRPHFHTAAGIARRIAENRGQGSGSNYSPWVYVQDDPSQGQRRRTYCAKVNRAIHTLCRIDFFNFLFELMDPTVIDFQENYPLNRDKSVELARSQGIEHPFAAPGCPMVLWTDLRVTRLVDGKPTYTIINGADSRGLRDWRTAAWREFDRIFWEDEANHSWVGRTQAELPEHFRSNAEWLLPLHDRSALFGLSDEDIKAAADLMHPILLGRHSSLVEVTDWADKKAGSRAGSAMLITRHLLANLRWGIDLTFKLDPLQPILLSQ